MKVVEQDSQEKVLLELEDVIRVEGKNSKVVSYYMVVWDDKANYRLLKLSAGRLMANPICQGAEEFTKRVLDNAFSNDSVSVYKSKNVELRLNPLGKVEVQK